MNLKRNLFTPVLLLATLFIVSACSSHRTFESDMRVSGAPDWVNGEELVTKSEHGKVIRKVGQAAPMGNISLQKTMAANRARAALAREISLAVESVQQDVAAGAEGDADAQADIASETNFNTATLMTGSRIRAFWKDKKTGDIYALAELELKTVEDSLKRSKSLSKAFKRYLDRHPEAVDKQTSGE